MSEKIKPDGEKNETDTNQERLLLLNAWFDLIEIKKGKPISEVFKDCIQKGSKENPED